MSRGDQGGCCCIAMYTGTPTFASKTEHIMSRYRPIAPKPLAPKPPEGGTSTTDPSDPQTSSSLSLDKGSSKGGGGSRRSRKRQQPQQTDSSTSASTINAKKASIIPSENNGRSSGAAAAAGSRSSCKTKTTTTPGGTTPRSKRREPSPSPLPHNNVVCKEVAVGLTPILSESVAPVFGPGGLQRFNESSDRSSRQSSYFVTRSLVNNNNNESSKSYGIAARDNSSVKLGFPGGSSSSWNAVAAPSLLLQQEMMPLRETEDAAFMERAAAANSPVFLGEVSGSGMSNQRFIGFSGLSFAGEILKGSPPAAVTGPAQGTTMPAEPGMMQQQENHQSSLPSRDTGGCSTVVIKSNESSLRGGGGAFMPLPYASASYGAESEVCSGEDVAESRTTTTNLVTLSLLPDAPIHPEGPSSPSDSSFPSPSSHAKSKSCFPSSHRYGGSSVDWNVEGIRNHHQPATAVADTNLTMFSRGEWLVDQEEECRDSTTGGGNKELTNLRRKSDSMFLTDNCFGPVAARDFVEQVSGGQRTQTPSPPPPHAIIQHLPVAGAVAGSDRQQQALNEPVVDSYYLDHVYATSSDAVMLTDEQNRILWSNSAFQRAATEKTSGKMQSAGPHIDPLGIPTQLAILTFQPPYHAAKCKAVLWGFLKKFIFQEVGPCFAESRQLGEGKLSQAQSHEHSYDSRTVSFDASMVPKDGVVYEGDLSLGLSPHKVIAPQPIKAVESMICLECITKVNPRTAPMMGTVEAFQDQLEKLPLPTIITDFRHKVQWVNTAYKHMVGRPECSWLSSMVGGSRESEAYSENQIARNVSFICAGEQPPVDAAEFSCQVRVQWTKSGGEKSSLVFPTDVIRLDDNSRGPLFVWKFDIFNGRLPLRI